MNAGDLWSEIGYRFDTDDGTLPDVWINNLPARATQHVFNLLASRADSFAGSFWHIAEAQNMEVRDYLNAPTLVEEGLVEPFHMMFDGVRNEGQLIPDLGAFFSQDCVAIDYRMGVEWNANVLGAFIDLLGELVSPFPGGWIGLEGQDAPDVTSQFGRAVALWLSRTR